VGAPRQTAGEAAGSRVFARRGKGWPFGPAGSLKAQSPHELRCPPPLPRGDRPHPPTRNHNEAAGAPCYNLSFAPPHAGEVLGVTLITHRLACVLALGPALILCPAARAAEPALETAPASTFSIPTLAPERAFEPYTGDGRRTMRAFGANLGRNLIGVVSRDNGVPFLLGVGAASGGRFLDGPSERFFDRNPAPRFGAAGRRLGEAGVLAPAVVMLFAGGRASHDQRFRAATYDAAQAFIVTGAYTMALKHTIGRERPDGSNTLSFPSGHTSTTVALAKVASHHYGPKVGIPAYAVAGLVGLSRIESKAHHLSDVIAGATLGYLSAKTVVQKNGDLPGRGRRIVLAPATGPQGTGVGLAVSLQF
jgi:membrane-associated phospholipid phosphatase